MGPRETRNETAGGVETGQESRVLTVRAPASRDEGPAERRSGGRPMAAFVTQLMLGADASLQVARLERTRTAAAQYAHTAASLTGKLSA